MTSMTSSAAPSGTDSARSAARSWPWVLGQLGLALVIFWPFRAWPTTWSGLAPGYALIVGGAGLMAWTLRHNRRGNWQVAPAVRAGARLVTTGPYGFVRHPMYVAVLGLALGFVVLDRHPADYVAWAALAGLFFVKARIEERALANAFADYAEYRRRTGGFWPWGG